MDYIRRVILEFLPHLRNRKRRKAIQAIARARIAHSPAEEATYRRHRRRAILEHTLLYGIVALAFALIAPLPVLPAIAAVAQWNARGLTALLDTHFISTWIIGVAGAALFVDQTRKLKRRSAQGLGRGMPQHGLPCAAVLPIRDRDLHSTSAPVLYLVSALILSSLTTYGILAFAGGGTPGSILAGAVFFVASVLVSIATVLIVAAYMPQWRSDLVLSQLMFFALCIAPVLMRLASLGPADVARRPGFVSPVSMFYYLFPPGWTLLAARGVFQDGDPFAWYWLVPTAVVILWGTRLAMEWWRSEPEIADFVKSPRGVWYIVMASGFRMPREVRWPKSWLKSPPSPVVPRHDAVPVAHGAVANRVKPDSSAQWSQAPSEWSPLSLRASLVASYWCSPWRSNAVIVFVAVSASLAVAAMFGTIFALFGQPIESDVLAQSAAIAGGVHVVGRAIDALWNRRQYFMFALTPVTYSVVLRAVVLREFVVLVVASMPTVVAGAIISQYIGVPLWRGALCVILPLFVIWMASPLLLSVRLRVVALDQHPSWTDYGAMIAFIAGLIALVMSTMAVITMVATDRRLGPIGANLPHGGLVAVTVLLLSTMTFSLVVWLWDRHTLERIDLGRPLRHTSLQ